MRVFLSPKHSFPARLFRLPCSVLPLAIAIGLYSLLLFQRIARPLLLQMAAPLGSRISSPSFNTTFARLLEEGVHLARLSKTEPSFPAPILAILSALLYATNHDCVNNLLQAVSLVRASNMSK
jgi:hypothetical protein